jgi:hypothetical protein
MRAATSATTRAMETMVMIRENMVFFIRSVLGPSPPVASSAGSAGARAMCGRWL